ncbi:hypothetical protein [Anaerotignum sp.]
MENNQNPTPNRPQRKQLSPRDLLILALIFFAFTRINFAQMNSFHVLILFLLFLLLMLRWANMRKAAIRKQAMERYKDQYEEAEPVNRSIFQWEDAPAESPAEEVSAADMTVDGEAVPEEAAVSEETDEKSAE